MRALEDELPGEHFNMWVRPLQAVESSGALKLLAPYFENVPTMTQVKHADVDPDLDPIRNDPRFQRMVADAKTRLGESGEEIAAQ